MITVGIDAGSRAIKIVLLDTASLEPVASGVTDQGVGQEARAQKLLDDLLEEKGLDPAGVHKIVATGYGRNLERSAVRNITEST